MSASKLRILHRAQLAAHRLQKKADHELLEGAGVTTAQAAVLVIIAAGQTVTQRHVARTLGLHESGVTTMVTRLLALELLERERDESDARAWSLRLTRKGQRALENAQQAFASTNRALDEAFTAEELTRFADYLSRVSRAFA